MELKKDQMESIRGGIGPGVDPGIPRPAVVPNGNGVDSIVEDEPDGHGPFADPNG